MIDKDTIIKLARSADWHVEADGYINSRVEAAMKAAYRQGLEDAAKVCEAEQDHAEQEKADKRFKAALAEGDERIAVDRGEHWMAVSTCNAVLRNAAKAIRAMKEPT